MNLRTGLLGLTLASSLLQAALGLAKCPAAKYVVHGRVVRVHPAGPVPGASVTLLIDGRDPDPWLPNDKRPLVTTTDDQGRFRLEFYFDTLKSYSRLTGHDCSRRARSVSLRVSATGFKSLAATLPLARLSERDVLDIDVPFPERLTTLTQPTSPP